MSHFPAKVFVKKDALINNFKVCQKAVNGCEVMAIVKANAYGHGLCQSALCFLEAGANWFGVAKMSEALELRKFFNQISKKPHILTWLYGPDAPFDEMVKNELTLSVSTKWEVELICKAADDLGYINHSKTPRIHLKIDTGFTRNGFTLDDPLLYETLDLIKQNQANGKIVLEGLWSHFACSDDKDDSQYSKITNNQNELFQKAIDIVENQYGLNVRFKHICASSGIINYPQMHYNMVRPGIMLYGLSPNPKKQDISKYGYKKAMKLEVQMNNVKDIKKGSGVSYGHCYHVKEDTKIGIVPLGYADGIMRYASGINDYDKIVFTIHQNNSQVQTSGDNLPKHFAGAHIAGRICMDQFMIDLGKDSIAKAGDWAILFGRGANQTSVDDWAKATDTINYEIITKITNEAPRIYD